MKYPILYAKNETDFFSLGLGVMTNTIEATVTEERNGSFYFESKVIIDDTIYPQIETDMLIRADSGHTLTDQRFRIKRIVDNHDGTASLYAEHISYLTSELSLKPDVSVSGSAESALQLWKNSITDTNPFVVDSDISTDNKTSWRIDKVQNARQALGGVAGSILDVWGGEYRFDNYHISLLAKRGTTANVLLAYGRNITDFEQERNIEDTYNAVYPYAVYTDDKQKEHLVTIDEYYVDAENIGNYPNRKALPVDFSSEFESAETPTKEKLKSLAQQYIISNDIGVPSVSITLSFLDLSKTSDYVDLVPFEELNLCDDVRVIYPKLGVNTVAKVVRTVWNVLNESYNEIEIGQKRASLSDKISEQTQAIKEIETQANGALISANGKNTNFYGLYGEDGLSEPQAIKIGDLWYKPNGDETEMYQWDGTVWKLVISTAGIQEAKDAAANAERVGAAAQATADSAKAIGEQAQKDADAAQATADNAKAIGEAAQAEAERAASVGDAAQVTADAAKLTGENAQKSADAAKLVGENAQVVADNAKAIGEAAQAKANEAATKGDNAQATAEAAQADLDVAKVDLDQAKADLVQNQQDIESNQSYIDSVYEQAQQALTNTQSNTTAIENIQIDTSQLKTDAEEMRANAEQIRSDMQEATNALNADVTRLTENQDGITQTIDEQSLAITNVVKKADDNETKLAAQEQRIEGFTQTVARTYATKDDANKAKTDAIASAKTETASQVKQLSDSITSTVSKVEEKIDGISIGNRNYQLKTSNAASVVGKNIENQTASHYPFAFGQLKNIPAKVGDYFTVSFDWEVIGDSPSGKFRTQFDNAPYAFDGIKWEAVTSENSKGFYSVTGKIENSWLSSIASSMGIRMDYIVGTLNVANWRFTLSSKPTDWTPAPEDVDANIDSALTTSKEYTNSQIQQTANSITSTVSATYTKQSDFNLMKNQYNWTEVTSATNLNDFSVNGNYFMKGALTNSPVTAWAYLRNDYVSTTNITQTIWKDNNPDDIYTRQKAGSTWTSWQRTATAADLGNYYTKTQTESQIEQTASQIRATVNTKVTDEAYNTANTGSSNANKWTRFLRTTTTTQYSDVQVSLDIIGQGTGDSQTRNASLYVRHKQQGAMGSATSVTMDLVNSTFLIDTDIKAVVTTNSSSAVIVDYYVYINTSYTGLRITPITKSGVGTIEYISNTSFGGLPSGSQTFTAQYNGSLGNARDALSKYADLKITTDGISTEVGKKVGKSEVISTINQSAERVLIDAKWIQLSGTSLIDNGVIKTAHIADGQITNAKIGSLAVTSANIADAQIITAKIADLAVTDAKISSLTANKLTAGTIDASIITVKNLNASNMTTGTLDASKVTVANIDAWNITTGNLDATKITVSDFNADWITVGSIDAAKITVWNLNASNMTTGTLDASKITVKNLSASVIITGTLDASKVIVANIDASKVTTGTMTANRISGGTIDANNVTINNLNASKITTGTLDASKVTVANIDASKITTGTLSADKINGGTINGGNVNLINLNANNISSGKLSAIDITGSTITGSTFETTYNADWSGRLQIIGATIRGYMGSLEKSRYYPNAIEYYTHDSNGAWTNTFRLDPDGIMNDNVSYGKRFIKFKDEGIIIKANAGNGNYGSPNYLNSGIELMGNMSYIDFHDNPDSTSDYKARIIYNMTGQEGNLFVKSNGGLVMESGAAGINVGTNVILRTNGTVQAKSTDQQTWRSFEGLSFSQTSTHSSKQDFEAITTQSLLQAVLDTDIVKYHFKSEVESGNPDDYIGFVINDDGQSPYKTSDLLINRDGTGFNTTTAVGVLLGAIKELNAKVEALENKIA